MDPQEIKDIRNNLSLTQEEFARITGVVVCTVNRWENGVVKPSPLAIQKIKSLRKTGDI